VYKCWSTINPSGGRDGISKVPKYSVDATGLAGRYTLPLVSGGGVRSFTVSGRYRSKMDAKNILRSNVALFVAVAIYEDRRTGFFFFIDEM